MVESMWWVMVGGGVEGCAVGGGWCQKGALVGWVAIEGWGLEVTLIISF